ncbi:PCRF domain-containing protein, partial [Hydrogenophaga borbori]|uniref:PCRF domain-containing protein n=1 Tax=Hydrogenophaga borbori TaxID=2294117 RepID=UPI00301E3302
MKPFVRHALLKQRARLHELDALLSAPDVVEDIARFRSLSREHAEASEVVAVFDRFLAREADEQAARDLLRDPERAAMAQEEIAACAADLAALDGQLQTLLLPRDPDDARPAFLEIRAGAGGD